MDKVTSIIAALDANKLPSTDQFIQFIDWIEKVALVRLELAEAEMAVDMPQLSAQGQILSKDLRDVLNAYKALAIRKNHDNILQDAVWHLRQGEIEVTAETTADIEQARRDIPVIRNAVQTLISTIWVSITTEGASLFQDIISYTRLALADAAELAESTAGTAKEKLREQERGYQEGERDVLGRSKKRLEEEKDVKVAWEHGMEFVKEAGSGAIGASKTVMESAEEQSERSVARIMLAYERICDRAQSDPSFKESLDTIFNILQARINRTLDIAADPSITLESFIHDSAPDKHVHTAFLELRKLLERLANRPLEPLLDTFRSCITSIIGDERLRQWFNDFFNLARKNLKDAKYAQSDESFEAREKLRTRWDELLERDDKWRAVVDKLKRELDSIQAGINSDKDLNRLREAHENLTLDLQQGLIRERAQAGFEEALDQVTWFWQDLFRYYVPQVLGSLKDVPIPRTEYQDGEIEFVLENLDISSFKLHPAHVYLRNITDVDISTSHDTSKTSVGASTHIRLQALQLALDDVSFWYRDKTVGMGPKEFTGLMTVTLPEKGIDVDMKLKLIPANVKGPYSREALKHFHTIEKLEVKISDEVGLDVKESDHPIMLTLFKPLIMARLLVALERALTEQLRAIIDWFDATAYDISNRMVVFEDAGLSKGNALTAAMWSELGRLQREGILGRGEMGIHVTGTGVVVERYEYTESGEKKKASFAMGAEPQILSGEKRGPIGTGSESLREEIALLGEVTGAELMRKKEEGRRQVQSFKRIVEVKGRGEERRPGWMSDAFEVACE